MFEGRYLGDATTFVRLQPGEHRSPSPDNAQPGNAAISQRGLLCVMLPGMRP
jgi:hypothetical protein